MIGLVVEEFTNSKGRGAQFTNIALVSVTKMFSTISSLRIHPPLFAHYFEAKMRREHLLKYSIYLPP